MDSGGGVPCDPPPTQVREGLSIQAARGIGVPTIPVWPAAAQARFLNAAYGYPAFQILIDGVRAVRFLGIGSLSPTDVCGPGIILCQWPVRTATSICKKSVPFDAGSVSTLAVILRAGGLELLQISDRCCPPTGRYSNLRVSNLAYHSNPLDVLLADGRVIYADVRFKETTSYKRIRPGTYEFFFSETNLTPPPFHADIETLDSAFLGATPLPMWWPPTMSPSPAAPTTPFSSLVLGTPRMRSRY